MTIYGIYYLSQSNINNKTYNPNQLKLLTSSIPCQYSCVLCLKKNYFLGTGVLKMENGIQQINIQFDFTFNATVYLNQEGTNGNIQLFLPDRSPIIYNLNYNVPILQN